jgi:hypothetical protein
MWIGLSLFAALCTLVVLGAVVWTTQAGAGSGSSDSPYTGL